jgi:dihydrofolate synthase/folylpolyglutamate synthase
MMPWTYAEALAYLNQHVNYEKKAGYVYSEDTYKLDRVRRLLALLGNPQEQYPAVIIAGTKGKGSTSALIEAGARAAGLRTGFYSSPHLHTFRERIRLDGALIEEEAVARLLETQLQPVAAGMGAGGNPDDVPTYYELCTALGFLAFAEAGVDLAVLEVGLGGRLDATNVVTPALAVITPISYDHMAILGDTLGKIAYEKAGIIKPGGVVLAAPQPEEAATVIRQAAAERGATLYSPADLLAPRAGDGAPYMDGGGWPLGRKLHFALRTLRGAGDRPPVVQVGLPLLGRHQVTNAHAAAATLVLLHAHGPAALRRLTPDALAEALRSGFYGVEWPGRLEILVRYPRPFVVVDGAHNGDSARRLREALEEDFHVRGRRVIFVLGANQGHNAADILRELAPVAAHAVFTPIRTSVRSLPAEELAALWAPSGVPYTLAPDTAAAVAVAQERAAALDARVICVTGSLYLVGEAREVYGRGWGRDPV